MGEADARASAKESRASLQARQGVQIDLAAGHLGENRTGGARGRQAAVEKIITNHLSRIPYLEMQRGFDEMLNDMKTVLAQYGARIAISELSELIKLALAELMAAPTVSQREAVVDRLRVLHDALTKHERGVAQAEREQQVAHIALMERQLKAIEALPDIDMRKDELPGRRREVERLRFAAAANAPDRRKAAE